MKKTLFYGLLCLGAGSLSSFAMAPSNLWILLMVTISILYVVLERVESKRQAFLCSWLFGFGYFLFGLHWIGNALLVEGNPYTWAWPLAVAGLPFILAFFFAAAGVATKYIGHHKKVFGYVIFVAIFAISEWLRGHIFTGFPWNLFAHSWVNILPIIQITSVGDIYLLNWLTLFWGAIGGYLFLNRTSWKQHIALPSIIVLSFILTFVYGAARLSQYTPGFHDNVQIKIVQPNIAQHEKWDRTKMAENFFKQIRLSYPKEKTNKATYIIWPETALSFQYAQDPTSMGLIKQMLSSYEAPAYLITGLLRRADDNKGIANAIVQIDETGQISNIYDKHHLVPFGEYIPFQKWIPLKPVANFSGFVEGSGPQNFITTDGITYSPLICYEAIFSRKVIRDPQEKPDMLINTTNDAWYGDSAGPHQHFVQTVFRAVEEGIPMIRSANTGISAVINPVGQAIHKTTLFKDNSQTIDLPHQIKTSGILKGFHNILFFVMCIASCTFAYVVKRD